MEQKGISVYSRVIVREDDTCIMFFASMRGQYDTKGKRLQTYVDTNIDHPNVVSGSRKFTVSEIRFYVNKNNEKFRKHILENGYFIFRICDMDIIIFPIHMMLETNTYFTKELIIPAIIVPYMSMSVQLRTDTACDEEVKVTCELIGSMEY